MSADLRIHFDTKKINVFWMWVYHSCRCRFIHSPGWRIFGCVLYSTLSGRWVLSPFIKKIDDKHAKKILRNLPQVCLAKRVTTIGYFHFETTQQFTHMIPYATLQTILYYIVYFSNMQNWNLFVNANVFNLVEKWSNCNDSLWWKIMITSCVMCSCVWKKLSKHTCGKSKQEWLLINYP